MKEETIPKTKYITPKDIKIAVIEVRLLELKTQRESFEKMIASEIKLGEHVFYINTGNIIVALEAELKKLREGKCGEDGT